MSTKNSKRILEVKIKWMDDSDADTSYLEQDEFADRLEQYRAGQFGFIGVRAEAEVKLRADKSDLFQRITSGGLWGIESDSGREYLEETEQEQLSELRTELKALGFSTRAISTAFKSIKREGN